MAKTATDVRTFLEDLVNPEVMMDMVASKLEKKIKIIPYAKLDTTLQGRSGDTVTIPRFQWDGDAQVVPEGGEIPIRALTAATQNYTVRKTGIGGTLTDEAIQSGHGDPVGEMTTVIARSIASRCDDDAMAELLKANTVYAAGSAIGYDPIVDAIDCFQEEENSQKVILVHPRQVTVLRKDADFISADKYPQGVTVTGEIGKVANAAVVPSKKVKEFAGYYWTPILKTTVDAQSEDESPALTYFLKKGTNIEVERKSRTRSTEFTGDQHYVVALTNDSRVVLLKTRGNLRVKPWAQATYAYHDDATLTVDATGIAPTVAFASGTYTVNLAGTAPKLAAAVRTGLGFANGITNAAVYLLEIPRGPEAVDWTKVKYNGAAVEQKDLLVDGDNAYLIMVTGLKTVDGAVSCTLASFTVENDGVSYSYAQTFTGMTLAT